MSVSKGQSRFNAEEAGTVDVLSWQLDIITAAISLAVSNQSGAITPHFHWIAKDDALVFAFHQSCRRYSAWLDTDGSIRYYREAGQFVSKISRDELVDGIAWGFTEYRDVYAAFRWPKMTVDNLKAAVKAARREWPEE